ncbi:HU family DNA-binding protein [Methyloversatilis sp.]|uniref:HU family DNA-binding protein n=1 Tax=Methyloversatilis sp. TaxID=2569862 RepID=UPI0035AEFD86
MNLNTKELAAFVAANHAISKGSALAIIESISTFIQYQTVRMGNSVNIDGLGKFKLKVSKARVGRNPRTGEEINIPETKAIAFKQAAAVKRYAKEIE